MDPSAVHGVQVGSRRSLGCGSRPAAAADPQAGRRPTSDRAGSSRPAHTARVPHRPWPPSHPDRACGLLEHILHQCHRTLAVANAIVAGRRQHAGEAMREQGLIWKHLHSSAGDHAPPDTARLTNRRPDRTVLDEVRLQTTVCRRVNASLRPTRRRLAARRTRRQVWPRLQRGGKALNGFVWRPSA